MSSLPTSGPETAPAGQTRGLRRLFDRARTNALRLWQLVRGRASRVGAEPAPLPPGHRPQDVLAILLLTVGIAVIILDIPTYPWLRSLPLEYRNAFAAITDIGKGHWILWTTGVFCLASLALEWSRMTWRVRMVMTTIWTYCAYIFAVVSASGIIVLVLKWGLGRARPKLYQEVGPVHFDFFAFNSAYTSFPSGHSTTIAALAASLALIFPSYRWLIIVCGFWIAFSRIMVGAHYPSDVIAGTLLGVSVAVVGARWMAHRRIGFVLSQEGALRPQIGGATARRSIVALWHVLTGKRSFYKTGTERGAAGLSSQDT